MWRGEMRQRVRVDAAGTVHAVLASWEVYDAQPSAARATMSTHPEATLHNFPRDMQWGQGLQLIEDLAQAADGAAPTPFVVTTGEWIVLVTRFSADGVTIQVRRPHRRAHQPSSVHATSQPWAHLKENAC